MQGELLMFGADLSRWRARRQCWFFRDMLDPPFHAGRIRPVIAALRTALCALARDKRAALYAPVSPERKDIGFNLHADLFLTTRLWLVFDEVPDDETGASLFLSRADLFRLLRSIPGVPERVVRQVELLMTQPIARDSFDRLYAILHGENHDWNLLLTSGLQQEVTVVPFARGEGYLIDDREWLHGRNAVSRAVTARRFHRLTFGLRASTVAQQQHQRMALRAAADAER
jgi:hypothetical protein